MFNFIGKALAQTATDAAGVTAGLINLPQLGLFTGDDVRTLVGNVINGILIVAGIIVVVFLVYGGILYTTAGGNSEQADKGKGVIINAIIGLVIIAAALVVTRVVIGIINQGTA